ncbi:MAG: helix-turn-helix domain-containing protein [Chitinophagales bacterium]|nr:helix-turn-helix domain-containing protein [Chitinophagales bacterium]
MISESILYIGLAQSLFAAFVLATKKRVMLSDKILIACLLTIALKFVVFSFHQQHSEFFDLQFSMGMIPLTFGPFLYLYTVYLIERRTKFEYKDLLHTLPFIILTTLYFLFFKDKVDFTDVQYFTNDQYLWVRVLYGLAYFSSIVTYTVFTLLRLRKFRKKLEEQFSYHSTQIRLLWLNFIFGLFVMLFLIYFITGGVNAFSYEEVIDTDVLSHMGLTVIAFAVSYFGLRQPSLARWIPIRDESIDPDLEIDIDEEENDDKKHRNRIAEDKVKGLREKLKGHMISSKPYLDPELSLYQLASQLAITKSELTELLNEHIGKNFFSFVNSYRVEEVIEKFSDPEYDNLTIIAIAYECGFNSKSTFNSLFKQQTGQTPSEFKKNLAKIVREKETQQ